MLVQQRISFLATSTIGYIDIRKDYFLHNSCPEALVKIVCDAQNLRRIYLNTVFPNSIEISGTGGAGEALLEMSQKARRAGGQEEAGEGREEGCCKET